MRLVTADVDFSRFDSWEALKIELSLGPSISCARSKRGRIWLEMEIILRCINEVRVGKMRVTVISRGLDILIESRDGGG